MSETVKAILEGMFIALLIGLAAVAIYILFDQVMSIIAGFFAWIIINLGFIW